MINGLISIRPSTGGGVLSPSPFFNSHPFSHGPILTEASLQGKGTKDAGRLSGLATRGSLLGSR